MSIVGRASDLARESVVNPRIKQTNNVIYKVPKVPKEIFQNFQDFLYRKFFCTESPERF